MRTQTTKQLEVLAFEKLPTVSIIIGATKVVYKRHEMPIVYCMATIGWALAFWLYFSS